MTRFLRRGYWKGMAPETRRYPASADLVAFVALSTAFMGCRDVAIDLGNRPLSLPDGGSGTGGGDGRAAGAGGPTPGGAGGAAGADGGRPRGAVIPSSSPTPTSSRSSGRRSASPPGLSTRRTSLV